MTRALAVAVESVTRPSAPWSSTHRLAAAMIELAILDLAGRSPILRRDATVWLTSNRPVRIPFTTVCALLNLDPGAVRGKPLGNRH